MRKLIFTLGILLALTALSLTSEPPVVHARECSSDTYDACISQGLTAYSNCRSFGNSYYDCTTLQNRIMWDCFRVNNCVNN